MLTAIVMITAQSDQIPEVAEAILEIPGVTEVYSVTGEMDLIAMVRVGSNDDLAAVVPGGIAKVPGVLATNTQLAFRTYSKHDLDAAFGLGTY